MEKYIITWEDGQHFVSLGIGESEKDAFREGLVTIIRCSDAKELSNDGTWTNIQKWEK